MTAERMGVDALGLEVQGVDTTASATKAAKLQQAEGRWSA